MITEIPEPHMPPRMAAATTGSGASLSLTVEATKLVALKPLVTLN